MQFLCAADPEPVLDFETKTPKTDEHGQPLSSLQLVAISDSGAEVIAIKLPGNPTVRIGDPVTVNGLVAIPWAMGNRNGIAFRATSVEPATNRSASTSRGAKDEGNRS